MTAKLTFTRGTGTGVGLRCPSWSAHAVTHPHEGPQPGGAYPELFMFTLPLQTSSSHGGKRKECVSLVSMSPTKVEKDKRSRRANYFLALACFTYLYYLPGFSIYILIL